MRDVLKAFYCERGAPSATKMAAIACLAVVLWHACKTPAPDWEGLAVFLGVPWGILTARKAVEPKEPRA